MFETTSHYAANEVAQHQPGWLNPLIQPGIESGLHKKAVDKLKQKS